MGGFTLSVLLWLAISIVVSLAIGKLSHGNSDQSSGVRRGEKDNEPL